MGRIEDFSPRGGDNNQIVGPKVLHVVGKLVISSMKIQR